MKFLKVMLLFILVLWSYQMQAQITDSTQTDSVIEAETENEQQAVVPEPKDSVQAIDWSAVKARLVFGGNLGLSYYAPFTLFEISPQIGYKVKENTIAGIGLQLFGATNKYNSYIQYGPDFFVREHLINIFFVQAQFEYINFENFILPGKRIWNPGMLVGFGYGTYGYSLGLYTDLVQTENSEFIYPGHLFIGPKKGTGRYPYGVPFFFRGQLLF